MTVEDKTSRLAGFLYLIVVVTGLFSLAYVPSQIPLSGDLPTAIDNIRASESLFRFGIAASTVLQVAFLLLPLVLFRLLRPVSEAAATCMVALAVVSVPLALISLSSRLDALTLVTGARQAATLTSDQLQAEVLVALGEHRSGLFFAMIFWGLIRAFGELLVPGYAESVVARIAGKPAAIGEIGTCLWLLIVGVRHPRPASVQQALAG
jgi:Domain of unknown function (DUF4386)